MRAEDKDRPYPYNLAYGEAMREIKRLSKIEEAAREAKSVLEATGAAWVDPLGYEETEQYRNLCRALHEGEANEQL